jgi:hypothetical protein
MCRDLHLSFWIANPRAHSKTVQSDCTLRLQAGLLRRFPIPVLWPIFPGDILKHLAGQCQRPFHPNISYLLCQCRLNSVYCHKRFRVADIPSCARFSPPPSTSRIVRSLLLSAVFCCLQLPGSIIVRRFLDGQGSNRERAQAYIKNAP